MGECGNSNVGCFSEFISLELYAEVFDQLGCLDKLEAFASLVFRWLMSEGRMAPISTDCREMRDSWS